MTHNISVLKFDKKKKELGVFLCLNCEENRWLDDRERSNRGNDLAVVVLPVTTICSCVSASTEPVNIEGQCLKEHCCHKIIYCNTYLIVTLSKLEPGYMSEMITKIAITTDEAMETNDKGYCSIGIFLIYQKHLTLFTLKFF